MENSPGDVFVPCFHVPHLTNCTYNISGDVTGSVSCGKKQVFYKLRRLLRPLPRLRAINLVGITPQFVRLALVPVPPHYPCYCA